ncbi:cysteine--tRNA ligase [Candidatus Saccharibacteria bacterium]|nr:cysteine--tRNA ligase [Candidatus Saccharibacteria bacterium]
MILYNTKTRKLEEIKPIKKGQILLYTCGPTVYNYITVGNWVSYIRWDILVRALELEGYKVTRVMNITDVGHLVSDADEGEDKMQKGARREGKTAWQIAKMYTDNFLIGIKKLDLIEPTYLTKATDFIKEQIELVKTLEQKGYTYVIDDGVYFDTSKFARYADFARLKLDELKAGARVEHNNKKKNASDFALWKFSQKGETRDMEWDSPWGVGFPGWHLECSAMALAKLGHTIDIHTGGIDHIPVHHTNEIAQSECATGKTFANYWVHNNFLLVNGSKISKSLGNGYTLEDIEGKGFEPKDFKMFVLQSHYRAESNFTWENLEAAKNRLKHWQNVACYVHQAREEELPADDCVTDENLAFLNAINKFKQVLSTDLDTPNALVAIEDGFSYVEQNGLTINGLANFKKLITLAEQGLGIKFTTSDITADQKELLIQREEARSNQNWKLSDKLREELVSQKIHVKDTKQGQIWFRS